jgi:hypothetical protein
MIEEIIGKIRKRVEGESKYKILVLGIIVIPYKDGKDMSCYTTLNPVDNAEFNEYADIDSVCVYSMLHSRKYRGGRNKQRSFDINCNKCDFAFNKCDKVKVRITITPANNNKISSGDISSATEVITEIFEDIGIDDIEISMFVKNPAEYIDVSMSLEEKPKT